jgi:sRNA-binding protein
VAPKKAWRAGAELSAAGAQGIVASGRGGHNAKPESTQQVTQAQLRARERRLAVDTLCVLAELFPAGFRPPSIRPLKIGIRADLIARAPVTEAEAEIALGYHCRSLRYLRGMIAGAARVDLDGLEVGPVTAGDATFAKVRIAAIRRRRKARKAAAGSHKVPAAPKPEPAKPTEARQRPSAGSGITQPPRRRSQPRASLGGPLSTFPAAGRAWRHERDDRLRLS